MIDDFLIFARGNRKKLLVDYSILNYSLEHELAYIKNKYGPHLWTIDAIEYFIKFDSMQTRIIKQYS